MMKLEICQLCKCKEDADYIHLIYDGRSNRFACICEKCREILFPKNDND